ncbi:MAG: zonular occludens toxin domain-containing protein [Thermoplasmata archaeon]
MIIAIDGHINSGKTLLGVMFSYYAKIKKNSYIVTNVNSLTFKDKYIKNITDMPEIPENFKTGILFIDEIAQLIDSRTSSSKINRLSSYFYLQSRKYRYDFIFTAQNYGDVDIRLRKIVDIRFRTNFIWKYNDKSYLKYYILYNSADLNFKPDEKTILIPDIIFKSYNTMEKIIK